MRLQVSAGRGPAEVVALVAQLARDLPRHLRARGGQVGSPVWGAGRRSFVVEVDGVDVTDWIGTHERVDPMRGRGRRRRWFVDVRSLEGTGLPPFDAARVRYSAARAGGPGGQHVNTTSSAVRAVYEPLGWEVRVASERSQHRNRAEALRRLRARHAEAVAAASERARRRQHRTHQQLRRGGAVVRWVDGGGRLEPVVVAR